MTSSWHKSIVWVIKGWRRVFSEWRRSSCRNMGLHYNSARLLIFSCDQAALRTLISVRPSVRLSVRLSVTPFWQCSCHRIILKFSGVITIYKRDVHAKGQGQRSRSQRSWPHLAVSGPKLQFELTYGDGMMHKAWYCYGEVPYCVSRSSVTFQGHTALEIVEFDPDWAFPDCNSSLNSPVATK